jgi:hypothetical protein
LKKVKLSALPRGASVARPSGSAPKPPDFALRASPRSPLAIPLRASAQGILAKASEYFPSTLTTGKLDDRYELKLRIGDCGFRIGKSSIRNSKFEIENQFREVLWQF